MVTVLLASVGAEHKSRDSPTKDTIAFVWLGGALAVMVGGIARLKYAQWAWVRKVGAVDAASFSDACAQFMKGAFLRCFC